MYQYIHNAFYSLVSVDRNVSIQLAIRIDARINEWFSAILNTLFDFLLLFFKITELAEMSNLKSDANSMPRTDIELKPDKSVAEEEIYDEPRKLRCDVNYSVCREILNTERTHLKVDNSSTVYVFTWSFLGSSSRRPPLPKRDTRRGWHPRANHVTSLLKHGSHFRIPQKLRWRARAPCRGMGKLNLWPTKYIRVLQNQDARIRVSQRTTWTDWKRFAWSRNCAAELSAIFASLESFWGKKALLSTYFDVLAEANLQAVPVFQCYIKDGETWRHGGSEGTSTGCE